MASHRRVASVRHETQGEVGERKALLRGLRRVVVKVGSGLIADRESGLSEPRLGCLAADVARLLERGLEVVLVSSGAVAAGTARLGLRERPRSIPEKQAAAAVGQSALMWSYERAFGRFDRRVAQVLLTQEDLSHRTRYLNARNTLLTLLGYGVLPVVNENDTVAVEEIKVGDNDNLSAVVAHLVDADLLVILTDIDGLFSGDPRRDPSAGRVETVTAVTPELDRLVWEGEAGTGGMRTKLQAAQKVTTAGIPLIIADGQASEVLPRVVAGESVGTLFLPRGDRLAARKRWIAFALPPQGFLRLDEGAWRAVAERGKSLLPSGVVGVNGEFSAGDAVGLLDPTGREFARGLVNYEASEVEQIRGARSTEIEPKLGYKAFDEIIHRDNLVLL
jgi:glutamate 5-kinase